MPKAHSPGPEHDTLGLEQYIAPLLTAKIFLHSIGVAFLNDNLPSADRSRFH